MKTIDLLPAQLETITGGTSTAPAAPIRPIQLPSPSPGMGFPKYSAGWWDLVRSRGLGK